ncbi:hypothetical protein MAPG_08357 [Magnaporthiopsis poae ATCC 64411]|uniref:RNase MRP protein 1 RNA binding domain-containing protein n=1 Tax=Magnaporthiopsis poae (strain ATCC 64411 / 73-15) TaxID=644358 RepID=A0A0C4E755_MAGP6|nr:hypothetical protein MAPG_08357 [Magnaporthiopsis poae ATCC 64411]
MRRRPASLSVPDQNAAMTTTDGSDKPAQPLPLARLVQARHLLAPAREILDRFNYKHKNQHRLSKWWAAFDTLRRHLVKLEQNEIAPAVETLELAARRSAARGSSSKRARDHAVEVAMMPPGVEAKSEWMRDYLIPKAYFSFTQLAADNQFAHLGLLLLGVLAQVHDLVTLILPPPTKEDGAEGREPAAGSLFAAAAPPASAGETATLLMPAAVSTPQDDVGVAVSRDDVALAKGEKQTGPKSGLPGEDKATKPVNEKSLELSMAEPRVKKKARKDDRREEKKKKKRKKGDEFDDLFSSLM